MNQRERCLPGGNEGISPELRAAVATIAQVNERSGVDTQCIIAFGSRARGEGMPGSDLDVLVMVNFPDGELTRPNKLLERARQHAFSVKIPSPHGIVHAGFLDTKKTLQYLRFMSPVLSHHPYFRGVAEYATVLYGQEPMIGDKPLIQYVRDKVKKQK